MAASQNIARLGIVLGMDSGELVREIEEAQKKFGKFKAQIKRDSEDAAKEIVRLEAATRNYGKTLTEVEKIEEQIRLGKYRNQPEVTIGNLLKQAAAYDKVAASAKNAATAQNTNGSGLTKWQQQAIMYQTTDTVTSLLGGQNPMMVLLQQGGQLKDQFGGLRPMFAGLAASITPVGLAVTGVAAAVGGLGLAIYQGREEVDKFQNSMILTGNFAGISIQKFNDLSNAIGGKFNTSIGTSRELMQTLVSSSQFTEKSLMPVASAIAKIASLSGEAASTVAQTLIPSMDGSASSAKKLNDQYHFLTLAQYKHIEALNDQGKTQEAIAFTADTLTKKLSEQEKHLGYLEKLWTNLKNAASGFWDWLKDIGRDDPLKQLKSLESEMNNALISHEYLQGDTKLYDSLSKKYDEIKAKLQAEAEKAKADSAAAEQTSQQIKDRQSAGGFAAEQKLAQERAKIIADINYQGAAAGLDRIADLTAKRDRDIANVQTKLASESPERLRAMGWQLEKNAILETWRIQSQYEKDVQAVSAEQKKKWADKAAADQNSIEKEQEKLQVLRDNMFASKEDIDIEMKRLEVRQKLAELDRERNMLPSDKVAAAERIKALGQEQEQLIKQQAELQKLQDMNQSVFNNMGNAIDNFVRTGKLSFKDLTRSIIQDLISIAMKAQMMAMFKGFNFFGPSGGGGAPVGDFGGPSMAAAPTFAANGASADAGQPFYVGEQGPELFVPQGAGTIMPNKMLGAMSNNQPQVVYNGPYIANMSAIDTQSATQFLAKNKQTIWAVNQSAQRSLPVSK